MSLNLEEIGIFLQNPVFLPKEIVNDDTQHEPLAWIASVVNSEIYPKVAGEVVGLWDALNQHQLGATELAVRADNLITKLYHNSALNVPENFDIKKYGGNTVFQSGDENLVPFEQGLVAIRQTIDLQALPEYGASYTVPDVQELVLAWTFVNHMYGLAAPHE